MDRKDFLKSTCGLGICSCIGIGLLTNDKLLASDIQNIEDAKNTPLVPVDVKQIQNVLSYIDSSMDEHVKKSIFEKLGAEHLAMKASKIGLIIERKI